MTESGTVGDRQPDRPENPVDEAATARATVDVRGIVTGWSEGARRLLGFRAAEAIGRPATELFAGEPPGETLRSLAALPRWHGTATLQHRDGSRRTVRLLAHRREAEGGGSEWLVLSPLARSPAPPEDDTLVREAFAQSPCTTALYDPGLRLLGANKDMERVIGLPEEAMRGLRVSSGRPIRRANGRNSACGARWRPANARTCRSPCA